MLNRHKNESETSYKPVVFSCFCLDAFVDSAVDGGLSAMPTVLVDKPRPDGYDPLLILREVSEEICVDDSWV